MGNINRRLTRLENRAGENIAVIVIMPGETEEQAREQYYAANPKSKEAKEELIIRVKFIGGNDERAEEAGGENRGQPRDKVPARFREDDPRANGSLV